MSKQATARMLRRALTPKGVHITSDDGQVDQSTVEVSKSMAEEVTWFAYGGGGATIVFSSSDGSPFQESLFQVPATGSVSSGPAKATAVENKTYKYTVVGQAGANDPGVIIQN